MVLWGISSLLLLSAEASEGAARLKMLNIFFFSFLEHSVGPVCTVLCSLDGLLVMLNRMVLVQAMMLGEYLPNQLNLYAHT